MIRIAVPQSVCEVLTTNAQSSALPNIQPFFLLLCQKKIPPNTKQAETQGNPKNIIASAKLTNAALSYFLFIRFSDRSLSGLTSELSDEPKANRNIIGTTNMKASPKYHAHFSLRKYDATAKPPISTQRISNPIHPDDDDCSRVLRVRDAPKTAQIIASPIKM